MTVSTTSAALRITPVVLKTFGKHWKHKTRRLKHGAQDEAKDDLLYDEAFNIVRSFIKLGTDNTVESLQAFTNTHVPSPFWAVVIPVCIPLRSCNRAADLLIDWFGPEDLAKIVGGERWWQVRGLDGIDGEWITEHKFLHGEHVDKHKSETTGDEAIRKMEKLETVMLYVHGGGYYWGSINTHRYQIIRYARKFRGRAFAVNYRKAPQYPWPCPLHDVLAAYFYLTEPPPDAKHKPVPASKIVFAGDSAGGALCVTALTVLRDMGLPLPAGAVLISPWVDLTHSFPSVMSNTPTDIIPPYGFVHKHSVMWPVDMRNRRVVPTETNVPPPPGHPDTLQPDAERVRSQEEARSEGRLEGADEKVKSQEEMVRETGAMEEGVGVKVWVPGEEKGKGSGSNSNGEAPRGESGPRSEAQKNEGKSANGLSGFGSGGKERRMATVEDDDPDLNWEDIEEWMPKPPKVLMEDPKETPLELQSQIQQYATNEQLMHPLVSPVLQGTLCNFPPLYIITGDNEVLRDEIIYLAHRAAHPDEFPARKGIIREGRRQKENVEKFRTPTKVHLQVYDEMPHVLTVFSFTDSAKYAYRAIAQFVRHVTSHSPEHLARNPFPELHRPECEIHLDGEVSEDEHTHHHRHHFRRLRSRCSRKHVPKAVEDEDEAGVRMYKENEDVVGREVVHDQAERMPGTEIKNKDEVLPASCAADGEVPTAQQDIPHILMIRERVDIHGRARPMEPKDQVGALRLRPAEVGVIKEAPVKRWLAGQARMDAKYPRRVARLERRRKKLIRRAEMMIRDARDQGFLMQGEKEEKDGVLDRPKKLVRLDSAGSSMSKGTSKGAKIDVERRWGPLDLEAERPPPSAIAGRRDTPEALALLKKSIYYTAPSTHKTVPRTKRMQDLRATFDPNDNPIRAPRQSVAEEQTHTHIIPFHGLSIWNSLVVLFMRKSSKGRMHAANAIERTAQSVTPGTPATDSSKTGRTP